MLDRNVRHRDTDGISLMKNKETNAYENTSQMADAVALHDMDVDGLQSIVAILRRMA